MFARYRIEFTHFQFPGLGPGALLGDIEISGVSRAHEFDEDGVGLCHEPSPVEGYAIFGRT